MLEEKYIYSGELCLYLEEIGIFSTSFLYDILLYLFWAVQF
jgi:hypothetical protein